MDKRPVDGHEFNAGDKREDADLGGRTPFPLEHGEGGCNDYENQDKARDNLGGGHAHHDFVQWLEVRRGDRVVQEFLAAHEEHADDRKSDDDGGLDASRCAGKLGLERIDKVVDVNSLVLIVETHHAEACRCVSEANDKAERADKERPVETGDDDEQKQDDEHRGAVQEGATVLGCVFTFFRESLEYGASHHHEQQREPEKCHARSTEILDARQDVVPKLEQRRMVAHAVAQSDNCTESPETCPTALAGEEQAEEPEEGEERTCVVVVELETVVSPVERAALAAGFSHLAVFVHRHIDEGTALERI